MTELGVPAPIPGGLLAGALGAAWTLLLALALGAAVLGRLDRGSDGRPRADAGAVLQWLVLGAALQSLAWLGLSALGALDAATLPWIAGALTLAAGWAARRPVGAAARGLSGSPGPAWRSAEALVGTGLLACTSLAVVALATRPTRFYDDLVYHLGLPRQALFTGSWPALPDFHYSFMPAGWDATYLLPLALGSAAGAQFLNAALFALLAVAVVRLARIVGAGPGPATLAAALLVACPMLMTLGAFAGDDLFVALALVTCLTRVLEGPGGARGALVAGLLAGAAWSAKYTALPGAAGCGLAWLILHREGPLGARLQAAGAFAAGVLLPAAAWNLRAFLLTGNPLYPAFFGLLGGTHWSAESAALVGAEVSHGAVPTNGVAAFLTGGWRLLMDAEGMGSPSGLNALLPWLGLAGLLGAARRRHRLPLAAAAAVAYLGWCLTSLNQRYALFLLAVLAAAAAALLQRTDELRPRLRRLLLALVAAAALVSGGVAVHRHLEFLRAHPVEPTLSRTGILGAVGAWRAGVALDRLLPEDARLLVIAEGRIAVFPRPVVASSAYDRPVIAGLVEGEPSLPEMTARARAAGFTHVVLNQRELARWVESYRWAERLPPQAVERTQAWLRFELLPVGRWGPVEVRALPEAD